MKKALLITTLVTAAAVQLPAHADTATDAKKAGVFTTATVAGTILGGPVGLFAGALGGAWLGEQIDAAQAGEKARAELGQVRTELAASEQRLAALREEADRYAQLALAQLQLELLFKTDAAELTPAGRERLALVADFLRLNPEIQVRLDGYADPRGAADYNRQLSAQRVDAVAELLAREQVNPARIKSFSHGAAQSSAPAGDYDAYAMERRVSISLYRADEPALAQVYLSE